MIVKQKPNTKSRNTYIILYYNHYECKLLMIRAGEPDYYIAGGLKTDLQISGSLRHIQYSLSELYPGTYVTCFPLKNAMPIFGALRIRRIYIHLSSVHMQMALISSLINSFSFAFKYTALTMFNSMMTKLKIPLILTNAPAVGDVPFEALTDDWIKFGNKTGDDPYTREIRVLQGS